MSRSNAIAEPLLIQQSAALINVRFWKGVAFISLLVNLGFVILMCSVLGTHRKSGHPTIEEPIMGLAWAYTPSAKARPQGLGKSWNLQGSIISCNWRGRSASKAADKEELELASSALEGGIGFTRTQSLNALAPPEKVISIAEDLQSNSALWDGYKTTYDDLFLSVENRLRKEDRSIKDLIGETSMKKLLDRVEQYGTYDRSLVTTFMTQPAIEQILSNILYEGIFEFTQKVDIIGNVVNGLPVIGPIRQQLVSEFKKALDRILGPQIKTFLASYNRVAVKQVIDLVVSPENTKAFSALNRNMVASILDRKPSSYLPDEKTSANLRNSFWEYLREVPSETISTAIKTFYEEFGDREFSEVIDLGEVIDKTPKLRELVVSIIQQYLTSPQGSAFLTQVKGA